MSFDIHIDRLLRVDPQEFLENATGVINLTTHDGVVTTIPGGRDDVYEF
jgi:hypothetical protein